MTIHILPSDVAAQIAAGEVVERPASVVKELVENALDAGASTITVEIEDGGKRLVRVSDNGLGIASNESELAILRHATSKLTTLDDLNHIQTLGFRGEALASIASVSRMTLTTRSADETAGTRLTLEGASLINREAIGAPQGTVITVENLFYNVPARLKFLKKEASERQSVSALVSRYALAYPGVRFTLAYEQHEALRTTGSGNLREVLAAVYGADTAVDMLEIEPIDGSAGRSDLPSITVKGFAGLPSLNRSNRNQITLFVNGRWIQDSTLSYAVVQAYHTLLMVGRYPVAVVMIELPPEEVDVNVHPAKAQVRFRQPDAVFSAVQRAIRQVIAGHAPPPPIRGDVGWGSPDLAARRARLSQITTARMSQLGFPLDDEEDSGQHGQQRPTDEERGTHRDPPQRKSSARALPMLRVVGQVGGTYVVAEGPQGLYLIDQHAAHERVLYERLLAERSGETVASQELLEAAAVELSPEQMALVEGSLDDLHSIGFRLEVFGRNTVQIRAVPTLLAQVAPSEALLGAIEDIECGEMPAEASAEQRMISKICKRVAVKGGQVLSFAEMEGLVRQLEKCDSPQTCPHGRPTMLHLAADELARQFGRLGAI
jgi:DNA mismatch repair protein MutL